MEELPSREELLHAFYEESGGAEHLNLRQFTELCYRYYLAPTVHDMHTLFTELDLNNDARLSIEEVSVLLEKQWTPVTNRKAQFLRDLHECRQNADGLITRYELQCILQKGQVDPLTDEEVDYCFTTLDMNGDKVISEEELVHLIYANKRTRQTTGHIDCDDDDEEMEETEDDEQDNIQEEEPGLTKKGSNQSTDYRSDGRGGGPSPRMGGFGRCGGGG